jgi:hypothetical protein
MVYFYFDFSDATKQQLRGLLRSLLTSLSQQLTCTSHDLARLYSQCYNGGQQPHHDNLVSTLMEMLGQFERVYVIVDALDECRDSEERCRLLEFMKYLVHQSPGNIHILATSRWEADIEACLKCLVSHEVNLQTAPVDCDIRMYLRHQLESNSRLGRWGEQGRRLIEENLMGRANGM